MWSPINSRNGNQVPHKATSHISTLARGLADLRARKGACRIRSAPHGYLVFLDLKLQSSPFLGRKQGKKGTSEFPYYSFSGGLDTYSERGNQPTFAEWLDTHHGDLRILVREHPTYDYRSISYGKLTAIEAEVRHLTSTGRTVVVVDSGGDTRTGKVCRHMKATKIL